MRLALSNTNINQTINNQQAQLPEWNNNKLFELSKKKNSFKEDKKLNVKEELLKMTRLVSSANTKQKRRLDKQEKDDRNNIIDWLIVVNEKLSHHDSTFILAIDILEKMMDLKEFDTDGLHLLCLASFFLASKYEEVIPIGLDLLTSKVGHNKFTRENIKDTELFILKKLSFILPKNHFLDFTFSLIKFLLGKKPTESQANNTIRILPLIQTQSQSKNNKEKSKFVCISNKNSVSILDRRIVARINNNSSNRNSSNSSNGSSNNLNKNVENTENVKKTSSMFKPNSNVKMEKEFPNVVYLFSIFLYKMLRIENNIITKVDNLQLYISIVHFAIEHISSLLNSKGNISQASLISFAERNGISSDSIKSNSEVIKNCFNDSKIDCQTFKYLNSINSVYFS
jgi:hypothetical protein